MGQTDLTEISLAESAREIRSLRTSLIEKRGLHGLRESAIDALCEIARVWSDATFDLRIEASNAPGSFSFNMAQVSLDGLISSITKPRIQALIESESPHFERAPELIGFVIAGNTPLLGWTALLRALLLGSGAMVKAPSSQDSIWLSYFIRSLKRIDPDLASLIEVFRWKSGDAVLESIFWELSNLIVVYGDDATIEAIRQSAGETPVLGYGHRVSFGAAFSGTDWEEAAAGFAKDILIYDQNGCLSPQTIFVEGDYDDALSMGRMLSQALAGSEYCTPSLFPILGRASRIRKMRQMVRFEPDPLRIWEDEQLRWTVACGDRREIKLFGPGSFVYVTPMGDSWREALSPAAGKLQGCSISSIDRIFNNLSKNLFINYGIYYCCRPGFLQAPPFDWKEDGRPLLTSLISR